MSHDPFSDGRDAAFESALRHATASVPRGAPGQTVGEVRAVLSARPYECASLVAVCEAGRLRGVVRIEDLLASDPAARIADVMDRDPPLVGPGVDQELASWQAVRHEESALCVVDRSGAFLGVIPPHRLLAVLLAEHEEDLSRHGGFVGDTMAVRATSEEPVQRRFRHRLPWLFVGLVAALLSADLVGMFAEQLQRNVALAFFIPTVVYLADAIGTQTETIVVRGLSVGVRLRRIAGRELLTGVAIGCVVGIAAGLLVWWRWQDAQMAAVVAASLLAACSTATITGMVLPWMLASAGFDPAFGSGPLATVVQDLLSIVIYLSIAAAIVA